MAFAAHGIFAGNGGPLTTIVAGFPSDPASPFTGFGPPSINNTGTVAFAGHKRIDIDPGPLEIFLDFDGVYTGNGGDPTTIATTEPDSPFAVINLVRGPVSINDNGLVAFTATLDDLRQGIFTGPDPVADKVIQSGDPLFGDTVVSVDMRRWGLNNAGQIAFIVGLANGRTYLVRADPVQETPTLIVIKHVVNDHGGTNTAADFTLTVTGNNPSPASFTGEEAPGTTVTVDAGNYSVTETGPNTYKASFSADCTGSIAAGETKTCTVTNDDFRLGKTPGFWSNKDGNAILDANTDSNLDVPVTIGSDGPRTFTVTTLAQSNKILLNRACRSGAPVIFVAPCSLSTNLKSNTLEVLAAQTLALQYNVNHVSFYTGQTIAGLSTTTNTCSARLTSPLTSLGLSSASTVNDVLEKANALIGNSAGGGTTTQAQGGAMNVLLSCLNRETP